MELVASQATRALRSSTLKVLCPKPRYLRASTRHDLSRRPFHASIRSRGPSTAPKSRDRGPVSEEDTQTDFGKLDVFGDTPAPATAIDACLSDGFQLDSGVKVVNGNGILLLSGEVFAWRPWVGRKGRLLNAKGQWECSKEAWGVLDLVYPKPDLLILGLGPGMHPISPETRAHINALGIRVDVQDTRNAAAQFNLLATERGVGNVAAALVPIGWREARAA